MGNDKRQTNNVYPYVKGTTNRHSFKYIVVIFHNYLERVRLKTIFFG